MAASQIICQGFDVCQGEVKPSTLVTGSVYQSNAVSQMNWNLCFGSQEVASLLDIQASVSGNYGIASMDAKVRFFSIPFSY